MDKQIIKRIINERQQEVLERQLVERPQLFERGMNYVLVGIRRAGKSCLMVQDMQSRIASGEITIEDCLYINFEDERIRYMPVVEMGVILDCYAEMYGERKPLIYLDEIQVIDGWEQFVRRLSDQQYRIMVTGSNAKMLSSEIATTLGGRFVIREVWPFSFKEYVQEIPCGLYQLRLNQYLQVLYIHLFQDLQSSFHMDLLPWNCQVLTVLERSLLSDYIQ